jgi:glutathione S-transferase
MAGESAEAPGRAGVPVAAPAATLYVIHGSHACRTAMLMLEHKGIPYRRVDLVTGLHPLSVRLRGFPGHRTPIREVDGGTHRSLAAMDRAGTVPALRWGARRVQTNREIARLLERERPRPPLFPVDPDRRRAVEEAERWGDEVLQMAARRIALAAALHGLDALHRRGSDGRLGPLLSPQETARRATARTAARFLFRASPESERELLAELPAMLDKVDAWIAAGVLDGSAPNAADFTIAPSLALLTYHLDLRSELERRPLGALIDRLLPEPGPVMGKA